MTMRTDGLTYDLWKDSKLDKRYSEQSTNKVEKIQQRCTVSSQKEKSPLWRSD